MKKINISFKDTEIHLLNYVKTKRSASNYIKDLIEEDLKRGENKDGIYRGN